MPIDTEGPLTEELLARMMNAPVAIPPPEEKGVGKLAKIMMGAGLGADMATTMYGMGTGASSEANPLLKPFGKAASPVGAAAELGGLMLLNKLIGKKKPKMMKAIMMGAGAAHGGAAIHNIGQISKGKKARDMAQVTSSAPPPAATEYINWDYFRK